MAFESQIAKADPAQLELAQVSAASPATAASIMDPCHKDVEIHSVAPGTLARLLAVAAILLFEARLSICQFPLSLVGLVYST